MDNLTSTAQAKMGKRSFRHKLRHLLAIAIAGLWRDAFSPETYREAFRAMSLWINPDGSEVDEPTYAMRVKACEGCPIFFSRFGLRTCGSPLDSEMPAAGCHCQIDEKARFEWAKCWGDERLESFGPGWKIAAMKGRGRLETPSEPGPRESSNLSPGASPTAPS